MADAIRSLIAQTYAWERAHKAGHRQVEAAACAIRRAALEDALCIVTGGPHRPEARRYQRAGVRDRHIHEGSMALSIGSEDDDAWEHLWTGVVF